MTAEIRMPTGKGEAPARRLVLATHSGSFHLDDAFAHAVLRLALGLRAVGEDHVLLRTRDAALLATADIVWDVGTVYDPVCRRYDHHQRGAPTRPDGQPFSAAGLVWRHHGQAAVSAVLSADDVHLAEEITHLLDGGVVRRIDQIDNGTGPPSDPLSLSWAVEDLNPPWDSAESGNPAEEEAAFLRAADLAEGFLRRRVAATCARLRAREAVLSAQQGSTDPRILELPRKLPWEDAVHAAGLPVLYAIYPVPNGNWMVDAMPVEPGAFEQLHPLPEGWAGLRDADLAAATGVADAVFVHLRRFVGAARSREGALAMARAALQASDRTT